MTTEFSTYEQQAIDFLEKHGLTFEAKFLRHGKHFEDDTTTRDIYELTLSRTGSRAVLTIVFGQSVNQSRYSPEDFEKAKHFKHMAYDQRRLAAAIGYPCVSAEWLKKTSSTGAWERMFYAGSKILAKKVAELRVKCLPTAYDLLACIIKSNPGTFKDFCSNYGYDVDSRSAERTYNSVIQEWLKVSAFFTPEQIEELQEIQ